MSTQNIGFYEDLTKIILIIITYAPNLFCRFRKRLRTVMTRTSTQKMLICRGRSLSQKRELQSEI